jgi:hypothetical protein
MSGIDLVDLGIDEFGFSFAKGPFPDDVTYGFALAGDTVTETLTTTHLTQTITFTQESGNAALYQITGAVPFGDRFWGPDLAVPGFDHGAAVTYGFSGLGSGAVTETVTAANESVTLTYAAEVGNASLYQISAETVAYGTGTAGTARAPSVSYSFTESNGSVTGVSETVTRGSFSDSFALTVPPTAVFTIGSGTISETFASGAGYDTVTYTSSGSGYVISSETVNFISQGTATTALDINPFDRAEFTISNGAVTAADWVGPSGATGVIASNSHVSYSLLATGYVEETVTYGTHSNFAVFAEGSGGNGVYTEVASGSGSTVDLVGLQAQLAHLPSAVAALL